MPELAHASHNSPVPPPRRKRVPPPPVPQEPAEEPERCSGTPSACTAVKSPPRPPLSRQSSIDSDDTSQISGDEKMESFDEKFIMQMTPPEESRTSALKQNDGLKTKLDDLSKLLNTRRMNKTALDEIYERNKSSGKDCKYASLRQTRHGSMAERLHVFDNF